MQYRTNRSLGKVFWLSMITFGIYGIWFYSTVGEDINRINTQKKNLMHYCLVFFLLQEITGGIMTLIWFHQLSETVGEELRIRGIDFDFGPNTFWLWNVLGSMIIVGPFIYISKLCKAMNLLCEDANNSIQ